MNKAELKKIPADHCLPDNDSGDCGLKKGQEVIVKASGIRATVKNILAYIPEWHPHDTVYYLIDFDGFQLGHTERGNGMGGKDVLNIVDLI